MFNEIPYFTDFTFFDSDIIRVYLEVLVQGALIQALSSKALIEKGRESSVQDSGLSYSPSQVSDVLSAQYTTELADYKDKVRYIKNSMRPAVFSSGILTTSTGARLPIIRSDQLRKVGRIF
jgi:NhaP-type Na+/H+ and K+/H+ antiporter